MRKVPKRRVTDAAQSSPINWSERLSELLLALSASEQAAIAEDVHRRALAEGVWFENNGVKTPIELAFAPALVDLSTRGYLHHTAWQVRTGLRHCVQMVAENSRAAALLPMEDGERSWFESYRQPGTQHGRQRLFCRLDALGSLEAPGWRERLRFIEANIVGIGGMSYAPPAERIIQEAVIAALDTRAEDMEFDSNADPRTLLFEELIHHAQRHIGQPAAVIALVDDQSLYTLGGELGRLQPVLNALSPDTRVLYCDPRDLEIDGQGHVVADGQRVDVVYRFLQLADFVEMEANGADLSALRLAFSKNLVVPSVGGELEHKSVFELLTNPVFTDRFDAELRTVLHDHVLWTRLLYGRETTDPDGRTVDLVEYARTERRQLVIKPNRAAGGEGVVIGALASLSEWDDAVHTAMQQPQHYVLQQAVEPVAEAFPVWNGTQMQMEPRYCAAGLFPGRRGLGVFTRFAASPVVNIQNGGGIVASLVAVR